MIVKVICPNCRAKMNYQYNPNTKNKRKVCVYCGRSFVVNRDSIVS